MVKRLLPLILLVSIGCGRWHPIHKVKHTGPCTLVAQSTTQCFWYGRPNNEIFYSCWDNPPIGRIGLKVKDISYQDDTEDLKHFIGYVVYEEGK